MEIFQSIILGIIQGIAEFLPISSTAHLILVPKFFQFRDPGLSFDVALHLGTLIAVISYFYRDWMEIFRLAIIPKAQPSEFRRLSLRKDTLWLLIIATIPGVLAGYFLEYKAATVFRRPWMIAAALVIGGLILYLADRFLRHKKNISNLNLKDSIIIGLLQAMAIIPGVSRSGATMIGGLWRGLDREGAARFSFLMSTPIILGAVAHQFFDFFQGGIDIAVIAGILASALSGYLAIKYMIKLIEKVSYKIFFWYRLALAAAVLALFYIRG